MGKRLVLVLLALVAALCCTLPHHGVVMAQVASDAEEVLGCARCLSLHVKSPLSK